MLFRSRFLVVFRQVWRIPKVSVKYRSSMEREEVKRTVERLGTMSLKKRSGKFQRVHN